jgi:DNA polymerase-1
MSKTLTIIDTFGFLFSNYYALPYLKAKNGTPTGMITGFMNFISNLGRDYKTDYILFSVDSKGPSFRNKIYPKYKANRPEAPQDLKTQLPIALELIKEMGFKSIEIDGYESDDIIASIANIAKQNGIKVIIVSHDKDMYQLIDDDKVVIFDPRKKLFINEEEAYKKFGVHPKDFINFQALLGDSSDNVPGVKGVGIKTAAKLINKYHTLENLYDHIDEIKGAMKKKLLEGKENAFLSRKLVTLKNDLFKNINLEEFKFPEVNPIIKVADKLIDLDMHKIIERVQKEGMIIPTTMPKSEKIEIPSELILDEKKLFSIIDSINNDAIVAFDTETTSLDRNKEIVGFSFAFNEKAYYVPINHFYLGVEKQISEENALKAIKKLFTKKIVGHNLKFDLNLVYKYGVEKITPFMDTMLLAWILDPDQKVGLDTLSKKYLNHEMIHFKDTVKKGENFSNVSLEEASKYASEDAYITLKLYKKLYPLLWSEEIEKELKTIEIPFIDILINMENRGIKVDIEYFKKLENKLEKKLENLTNEIYELAGERFNINSTKQLAFILFEKLGLPAKKKTKTGYSTNEAVLNSLKEYPIVHKLLEYRELFKLQSTYIKPLQVHNQNGKVYTSFLQTGTATGRLSSKDPNLQNIPTNKDINIRNGFIASEGKWLVSLDYSQIELRLLAHFSEDATLIKAFNENKDIHLETATKIFGEEKAKEHRSIAKSINFGLIYGMGARKLADTINVSNKEAKEFIEKYFASFPTVKNFLNEQKELVKKRGYVETLLKRRRVFDFKTVNSFMASNFEREAVNTIFQGSAADLIKLAMLEIEKLGNNDMILQIHDELIFETNNLENIETYKNIMENIFKLKVPLKVGVSKAKRWGEIK